MNEKRMFGFTKKSTIAPNNQEIKINGKNSIKNRKQMNLTKSTYLGALIAILLCTSNVSGQTDKELRLWYDQPAESWMTEALPIGNGYMGAMIFGGVEEEHIQF
ncbi:MAG TPA: glycoside hydrolase N-terminal domain-containing protein, partial [Arenibacter sp.]|nr:glycoside hydrolase N-terminal domain-containing protein [Arenibacter sp.]